MATPQGALLIPVRYGRLTYPPGLVPTLCEVPSHFDIRKLRIVGPYSLHTDASNKARRFDHPALVGLSTIVLSQRRGTPNLWTSREWAVEFAEFLFRITSQFEAPTIIEVHPPYREVVPTMAAFLNIYEAFEDSILGRFPDCRLVVENRTGTRPPREFLLSTAADLLDLGEALDRRSLNLKIALDVPQLFTVHLGSANSPGMKGAGLVDSLHPIRHLIHSLHIWGRKPGGKAHFGTLDDLFGGDQVAKDACLASLRDLLADGCPRYLVPEVNGKSEDLWSILADLQSAGFGLTSGT